MLCYVGAGFRPAPIFLYLSDVCNKRAGLKPAPTDLYFLDVCNKGQV
jgi:hypothetical protein